LNRYSPRGSEEIAGIIMSTLNENKMQPSARAASPHVKVRMLQQMAEAIEDEASALYRRAACFEEDEFLLVREIEERQTEINRLQLKLGALRSERDNLIERIGALKDEATSMREEVFNNEEELALAAIDNAHLMESRDEHPTEAAFFHRMSVSDYAN
jgi:hypothetical protein